MGRGLAPGLRRGGRAAGSLTTTDWLFKVNRSLIRGGAGGAGDSNHATQGNMRDALFRSLSLVDASGYLIITAILLLLMSGIACTLLLHRRYVALQHELEAHGQVEAPFQTAVLNNVVRAAVEAQRRHCIERVLGVPTRW